MKMDGLIVQRSGNLSCLEIGEEEGSWVGFEIVLSWH